MLAAIIQSSVRRRGIVLVLAGLLVAYGIFVASRAKLDVFPDFVPPQVVVQTEAPGLAPEQVETLVTMPVESALNGLGNLESLRSESIQGLSIVTAVFRDGTDIFAARQLLSERLAELGPRLPAGVKAPRMPPLTSSTMDLLKVGLVSDQLSPRDLRAFADWTLRPRLLAVPGVAKCSAFGGEVLQWQVLADPDRMQAHDLALPDVLAATRQATAVLGAGFVETANQRIPIGTEGQSLDPAQLGAAIILQREGVPVRLRDVAEVRAGTEPMYGDAVVMGRPGVLLTLSSQYGANTLEVTRAVEAALDAMKDLFARQGIVVHPRMHRPATFVETSLRNIRGSLWLGGALVAAVLLGFLGRFRIAVISIVAIPLSLLAAIIVLVRFGVTLNTITLGGLAIAIGEVVDDAIIDVENIFRRLRENAALPAPRPAARVILEASLEVRTAVVHATFVVALVFLPVLSLSGLQGKFFAPLALAYIVAILASLAVALTVTPALAMAFLGSRPGRVEEPWLQRRLKRAYAAAIRSLAGWHAPLLAAVALVCVFAIGLVPRLGGGFLPDFREGHFVVQANAAPGTGLPEMRRLGILLSKALLALPGVATVEQQIGRAELGEDPWGPHRSELHVDLKPMPADEEARMAGSIRAVLAGFPGLQTEVLTFLGDRIGETISGETAPVVVNVFGDDLDALDAKAGEVARVLRGLGAADVVVKSPAGAPRVSVRLRMERLAELGFRPAEVLEAIQTAYQGIVVAQVHAGNRVHDVAVLLGEARRRDPESIGGLLLRNAAGTRVPLHELASIEPGSGRHSILHEGARRRQTVTCTPGARDVGGFVAEARRAVAGKVALPGMYVEFGGTAAAAAAGRNELLLHSAVAAVGILLLLSVAMGHWRNLLLVLCNLPFALVGGILAVALTAAPGGGGLDMGALVGFVTLFGITMRNSIMLVSHYEHLVAAEGHPWNVDTAVLGAAERLVPILMTAAVTALGLLPLALGAEDAGREIEGPMAIVILGGLITSTALNLVLLPVLALRFGRFDRGQARSGG
ncbi:MAG: efflux RND transporter permease subunit [Verrucomicrobia bacterium]|nr:MAG: efflux RND transporter permease subunit [Verrucomicrobiota bacterium]